MNTETRKKLEWAFYNYDKLLQQDLEKQDNILLENITSDETKSHGGVGKKGSTVENKAFRLMDLFLNGSWLKVVENTFTTFKWGYEYEIMLDLYFFKKSRNQILEERHLPESSYQFMKNKWLNTAYNWALEFRLLEEVA